MTPVMGWVTTRLWLVLTTALAVTYLAVGATSPVVSVRWSLVAGGVFVLLAVWWPRQRPSAALTLLLVGALLPAAAAWWSIVVPVTSLMVVICGVPAIRAAPKRHADGFSTTTDLGRQGS